MAEYQDDLALIVRYDGTKEAFDNVRSNYKNKVVFIYGSKDAVDNQEGLVQAIWVGDSQDGRYLDMANVGAIKEGLTHIAGFAVENTVIGIDSGANGINFKGANGIEIKLNPSNSTDNNGVPYWNIEVDGKELNEAIATAQGAAETAADKADEVSNTVTTLIAGDDGKTIREIAADEANDVKDTLLGKETNETDTDTIRGVNNVVKTANLALFGKITPSSTEKIQASALPDVILGQLKFGGTVGNTQSSIQNQQLQITPSADLYNAFTDISSQPFDFTPTNDNVSKFKGWYFIVAEPAAGGIGNFKLEVTVGLGKVTQFYEVGDWLLSTGIDWVKIDNTDAVTMVAGMQGNITTPSLVTELSTADDENTDPLAKKSDITIDNVAAIAKIDGTQTRPYFIADRENDDNPKEVTITATMCSMDKISKSQGEQGFADARDVYDFIKARLSIKVVK